LSKLKSILIKRKQYYQRSYPKHREEYLLRVRKRRQLKPKEIQQYNKKYKMENKEKIKDLNRDYYLRNREKWVEFHIKHFAKYAKFVKSNWKDYKFALRAWSLIVRHKFNNKCSVCNQKSTIAHHIFFKQNYPELSLNLNNGISLCIIHHNEIHSFNGKKMRGNL